MRRLLLCLVALAVVAAATGCGSSGSSPTIVTQNQPPDLTGFLRLPVATPSSCPSTENGSTDGRRSPWVGRVDVSVFLTSNATTRQVLELGSLLRADRLVRTVYFESKRQAYQEFQRLYTCWTAVPRSQTPASYRMVLGPTATFDQRNSLVARLARLRYVDSVSCDPSVPCVNVLESATASASPGSGGGSMR